MTKSPPQPAVSVEQCDLDAAAEYNRRFPDLRLPEAFAIHRLSAAPPADGVLLPRAEIETLSFALRMEQRVSLKYWGDKLTEMIAAAPKAPTVPIGEAGRPEREEIAEAVRSLLDDKVHAEARRRHLADATQSGYEHHLIRVAGEMAITRFCVRAAPASDGLREAGNKLAAQARSYQRGFSGSIDLGKALNEWDKVAALDQPQSGEGGE